MYILYNSSYGGFSMNRDFMIELLKRYPPHTDIGKTIFQFGEACEIDFIKKKLEKLDIEYFMDYIIHHNNIINIKDKLIYDIRNYDTELRSNQKVIEYIFERTYFKIIQNNEFTPYFYHAIFQLDMEKFSTILTEENHNELVDLEYTTQENIYSYKIEKILKRSRRRRIIENNNTTKDLSHIKFYKNGFKINDTYYKFTFDVNITLDNLFEIISNICDGSLLDYIFFDDINGEYATLSIQRIKCGYIWKISEYDGSESIKLNLPYEDIISDLLNKLWNTENYNTRTKLTDYLINKQKTLKELSNEMYD
jgi:hypothetical protein